MALVGPGGDGASQPAYVAAVGAQHSEYNDSVRARKAAGADATSPARAQGGARALVPSADELEELPFIVVVIDDWRT